MVGARRIQSYQDNIRLIDSSFGPEFLDSPGRVSFGTQENPETEAGGQQEEK
jgi:hypothetical protein